MIELFFSVLIWVCFLTLPFYLAINEYKKESMRYATNTLPDIAVIFAKGKLENSEFFELPKQTRKDLLKNHASVTLINLAKSHGVILSTETVDILIESALSR